MKKIVVTGAAGLVGQNLIPLLLRKNHRIIAIDRNRNNLGLLKRLNPKINAVNADISSRGDWELFFKGADIVIQLQAQIAARKKQPFVKSNVNSVKNVLDACKKYKIKNLIHLSSSVVISVAKDDYTETKRAGEKLVHRSPIPHTILRPPLMYGCFDAKHLGNLARIMDRAPIFPLIGSGKYMRQPLFVMDLCTIILKTIERKPENKIYNIIGHEKIDLVDILKEMAKVKGLRIIFLPIPIQLFNLLLRLNSFFTKKPPFTSDQLKAIIAGDEFPVENWTEEFRVKYTPFREGIRKTYRSKCSKYSKEMAPPH